MKVSLNTEYQKAELLRAAKLTRETAKEDDIEVFGVVWQVNELGRDNMRNAIETAVTANIPAEVQRNWILADNSLRPTTVEDLRQVLIAYTYRLDQIFQQYTIWRMGGANTVFTLDQ